MGTLVENTSKPQPDFATIKPKQKATWEDGDYHNFASYMHAGAVEILEGWDLSVAQSLLNVGCGSGQTATPAAKQGLQVAGIDIAENLIEQARQTAKTSGLNVRFTVSAMAFVQR